MMQCYDTILYICNSILFILGVIIISYSLYNLNNKLLSCENIYYISISIIVNSIIGLSSIKNLKILGMITTIILFSYSIYNISNNPCYLYNSIYITYILSIINNFITIYVYLMYYSHYNLTLSHDYIII